MSSSQTPEHAFDMFTDSTYFDEDILPTADVPLPSIECTEDLPANFFDSAFDIGFDDENLHSDMSVWPADGLLECSDNREADPVDLAVDGHRGRAVAGIDQQLERLLLRPDIRADRERVEVLLHRDFQEFGASGRVWDREKIVDALVAALPCSRQASCA